LLTARATFATSPQGTRAVRQSKDGKAIERARWKVERPAFEADAEAVADPVMNPIDLGAVLPPADWLVLGPEQQARVTLAAFSSKEKVRGAEVIAWFESRRIERRKPQLSCRKASAPN